MLFVIYVYCALHCYAGRPMKIQLVGGQTTTNTQAAATTTVRTNRGLYVYFTLY